jgi:hypothetical protein
MSIIIVDGETVNLYEEKDLNSPIIKVLGSNSNITMLKGQRIDYGKNWIAVSHKDNTGFIYGSIIEKASDKKDKLYGNLNTLIVGMIIIGIINILVGLFTNLLTIFSHNERVYFYIIASIYVFGGIIGVIGLKSRNNYLFLTTEIIIILGGIISLS